MATDKLHAFNDLVADWSRSVQSTPFWSEDGQPCLDYAFLTDMLAIPLREGDKVQSGRFAGALDLWIAQELCHAGFSTEGVWPRPSEPRVISPDSAKLIDALRASFPNVAVIAERESVAQSEAYVLGSVYAKQVDVGMSSWLSGPELLISSKTMSGSFGKNLANRFEEAYGDVKNLRERYPLAAHGFFFVANASILSEPAAYEKAVHMLRQLSRSGDVYDGVALLLLDWSTKASCGSSEILPEACIEYRADLQMRVPKDLSPEHFFTTIIDLVLRNSPIGRHGAVRAERGML